MSNQNDNVLIRIQMTPNPHAWKFILDRPVLSDGKATYSEKKETLGNPLAESLFSVEGVKQVHFFQNVITITHAFDILPEQLHKDISTAIRDQIHNHNPHLTIEDEKKVQRQNLTPELQKIEEILDRTVRPGLQGDGGDIEVLKYEDGKLFVFYQGACGTCPSATTGTLMAIEGILKQEFDPQIEVIPYN